MDMQYSWEYHNNNNKKNEVDKGNKWYIVCPPKSKHATKRVEVRKVYWKLRDGCYFQLHSNAYS